ncbi:phenol 2-monooxygenase [Streptomyces sp. SID2999]|uniref:phenol 2-monooxygenase n=1 Tax=Streptomyces sp. SID2999 TaxID=2690258 RepID=UPI00136E3906|nr:phenol 2-monooxygenase [Streptomyces sp. SID2999]
MQYELRQNTVAPRRNAYQVLIERNGDVPASRYQEGTVGIQPRENFHYRPLWAPEHELYDETFSALRLTDPEGFVDPRQYYYAPYVAARAALHDGFAKTLDYLDKRDLTVRLPDAWAEVVRTVVVPLRHYESGAQLISVAGARFAWGTPVAQCLSYAAFDRIGIAQMLSRIGISVAGGTDEALAEAKGLWIQADHLQRARRNTEELMATSDWAAGVIGQDLVDQLVYPVLYQRLDDAALLGGAGPYSLLTQHLTAWYVDHRRWLDALYTAWTSDPEHGEANRAHLADIVRTWLPAAVESATDIAAAVDAALGTEAVVAVAQEARAVRERFAALGVSAEGAATS